MTKNEEHDDEWTLWWDARVTAMESVLGKPANTVGHGVIPFQFGAEMGGAADIANTRSASRIRSDRHTHLL